MSKICLSEEKFACEKFAYVSNEICAWAKHLLWVKHRSVYHAPRELYKYTVKMLDGTIIVWQLVEVRNSLSGSGSHKMSGRLTDSVPGCSQL